MKHLSVLILIILSASLAAFGQSETTSQNDWKLFSPDSEEFSVEIPNNLTAQSFSSDDKNRRYTGLFDETYYFIFSDTAKEDFQYKTVIKFIENKQKPELEKQINSAVMKFSFSDDEDFYHTIRTVRTKKRAYVFHLVSLTKNDAAIKRFFDTLKINAKSVIENKTNKEYVKNGNLADFFKTDLDITTGRGESGTNETETKRGIGVAADSGFSAVTNDSKNQTVQNKLLQITFKPKAKYNDFARFYEITGNVRVPMSFRYDGTIEVLNPRSKLPFGLTNSAKQAAQQMRFEPQMMNGKNVSVTKTVIFNFTIY